MLDLLVPHKREVHAEMIVVNGGAVAVVDAMRHHPHDAILQQHGQRVLDALPAAAQAYLKHRNLYFKNTTVFPPTGAAPAHTEPTTTPLRWGESHNNFTRPAVDAARYAQTFTDAAASNGSIGDGGGVVMVSSLVVVLSLILKQSSR
jgi:hypothetical protein